MKPGPSKTLVAPVQLISNFWGGINVTGTAADNEMMINHFLLGGE